MEVHGRLVLLARVELRVESALCFYLQEVEERGLYIDYGHACTVDYARECLGFEDRKTRTLLHLARRFKELPEDERALQSWRDPLYESEGGRESRDGEERRRMD